MARTARKKSRTGMYNVILKGRIKIFRDDDDYREFIERLDGLEAEILGFGLISGYAFLCIRESKKGIAADLRPVIIGYARYYNKKYGTEGRLFDGRFKSEPINDRNELQNSISLVQCVSDIVGEEGYVSSGESREYKMIPFFAAATGQKPQRKRTAEMKESRAVRNAENRKKNLPSWLL